MTKTEKIAHKKLLGLGYLVEKPIASTFRLGSRFIVHRHDLFGIWDFICVDDKEVLFIQESAKYLSQKDKEKQELIKKFPSPKGVRKQYWRWNDKTKEHIITEL